MRHRLMLLLCVLTLLLLAGCRYSAEGGELPTIGPIREPSGDSDEYLAASTNCAEVGERMIFTVRIIAHCINS